MTASRNREARTPVPAAARSVAFGGLSGLVGYQIRRANGRSVALWDELVTGQGVAWGHYSLLTIISRNPGLIQKQIAEAAQVDQTTVVPIINRLEAAGLVARARDAKDGRNVIVRVTPLGRRHLKRVDGLVEHHDRALTRGLSGEDRETLLRLLAEITGLPAPPVGD